MLVNMKHILIVVQNGEKQVVTVLQGIVVLNGDGKDVRVQDMVVSLNVS